jgi:hypothetical protein
MEYLPGKTVAGQGRLKVLDFGLAKIDEVANRGPDEMTRTVQALTDEGAAVGSAPYMSPEQAEAAPWTPGEQTGRVPSTRARKNRQQVPAKGFGAPQPKYAGNQACARRVEARLRKRRGTGSGRHANQAGNYSHNTHTVAQPESRVERRFTQTIRPFPATLLHQLPYRSDTRRAVQTARPTAAA